MASAPAPAERSRRGLFRWLRDSWLARLLPFGWLGRCGRPAPAPRSRKGAAHEVERLEQRWVADNPLASPQAGLLGVGGLAALAFTPPGPEHAGGHRRRLPD